MTDMRTIGLETFLSCDLFFTRRLDMKNSKDTTILFLFQKYGKVLCLETILVFLLISCSQKVKGESSISGTIIIREDSLRIDNAKMYLFQSPKNPILGIDRLHLFVDSLVGKRIAVVANQTSMVKSLHLVDTLLALKLNIVKVFSPEHGFRGDIDAGEKIDHSVDEKTCLPLYSLYGNNKKPSASQLEDVDIVIYDIQDVGVRFYTFISTLHYVMEACAENNKQLLVLDRPNPNGHYVDGPVLELAYKSFVGMHPVPVVYGMTIGEYAMMINGEGWLSRSASCNLWIIPCKNYTHKTKYSLPISPSPNLKSDEAISLYPSLCFFEATTVSIGRGTEKPFEVFGHPKFPSGSFSFTPIPQVGAKNPLHVNKTCTGFDLSKKSMRRTYEINLNYLLLARDLLGDSTAFIDQANFFNRLAGTASLKEQILKGWSAREIRETWKPGLDKFLDIRKKYLLYN